MHDHKLADENMTEPEAARELAGMTLEHLKWQNEIEYELGDSYDVKTSIALVIILFLAAQSATFLASPMPYHWHNIQILSAVCLIVAGVLSVLELIPRTYKVGLSPNEYLKWLKDVKTFYGEGTAAPETKTVEFIRRKQIEQMTARFTHNRGINATKSRYIEWVFGFTMAALVINLTTLTGLMSGWRF